MNEAVRGKRLSQPYWKLNRDGPKRTCPGATSAVGMVDVGFSDSDMSCNCCSRMRLPHQFPFSQWERPLRGPQETAGSVCALASEWEGIWKAIEWHPAMGTLACASAPQAQVCYMFPSGIILDTGIS